MFNLVIKANTWLTRVHPYPSTRRLKPSLPLVTAFVLIGRYLSNQLPGQLTTRIFPNRIPNHPADRNTHEILISTSKPERHHAVVQLQFHSHN